MALTPSTMQQLGTVAAPFSLPDVSSGKSVALEDFNGQALLVVFSCNHCPYVLHLIDSFSEFANDAQRRGLAVVVISANDAAAYPADSPDKMAEFAARYRFQFPYLHDQSQQVALDYQAACTPDFYLYDHQHRLVYRGQYDGSRPGNNLPVNGDDLKSAVEALLAETPISRQQTPSVGCSIKWRAGNAPDYS